MVPAILLAASLGLAGPGRPPGSEAPRGLSGTWIDRESRSDGPLSHSTEHEFTVRKNEFSFAIKTEAVQGLRVDSRRDPIVAEVEGIDAAGERSRARFLLKAEGDTLLQCSRSDPSERLPEAIESTPGGGNTLTAWRRIGGVKDRGIEGSWTLVRETVDGREVAVDEGAARRLTIGDGTYRTSDVRAQEGTLRPRDDLNWSEPAIDLAIESGTSRGEVWMGIFAIDRDGLRLSYNANGRSRPMSFNSGRRGNWRVTSRTFRRQPVL